jgi:hypothetical protein
MDTPGLARVVVITGTVLAVARVVIFGLTVYALIHAYAAQDLTAILIGLATIALVTASQQLAAQAEGGPA